jgi:hypothetical protein
MALSENLFKSLHHLSSVMALGELIVEDRGNIIINNIGMSGNQRGSEKIEMSGNDEDKFTFQMIKHGV